MKTSKGIDYDTLFLNKPLSMQFDALLGNEIFYTLGFENNTPCIRAYLACITTAYNKKYKTRNINKDSMFFWIP